MGVSQLHTSRLDCAAEPTPPKAQLRRQLEADWLHELLDVVVRERLPSRRQPRKPLVDQTTLQPRHDLLIKRLFWNLSHEEQYLC